MKLFNTLIFTLFFLHSFGQVYTGGKITGMDSCDFSTNCSIVQPDTPSGNTWTLSNSQTKPFLGSGYNDSFALVTDTARYYKTNTVSSFTVFKNTGEESNYTDGNFLLSFMHKINSDSASDGGFIEVSYDGGLTWKNVILDEWNIEHNSSTFGFNMYTKNQLLANGEPGFSGDIKEWTLVEIPIIQFMLTKRGSTLKLRFTFISDNTPDEKEGWAIDNVKLSAVMLPGGLNSVNSASQVFSIGPNPSLGELHISATNGALTGSVSIYSMEGKLTAGYTLNNTQKQQFDINALPAGMYSIVYRDGVGNRYFQKFVKSGY
jgi:hypothetical protein